MKIESLSWHFVEDYDFYKIRYILDGYWHIIKLNSWNIDCEIPEFMCKALRATLVCDPEEKVYR